MKLIIVEGDFCYKAGDTRVVGADWTYKNSPTCKNVSNLVMLICADEISNLYIYKEISYENFIFCLSRVRSREKNHVKNYTAGVVSNLEGLWFGKEQILDFKNEFFINGEQIEEKYINYWKKNK